MYQAFAGIAARHGFPPDFPTPAAAIGLARDLTADPTVFGVVAETQGRIVGSNFLSEGDVVRGVGPITVAPEAQRRGIGRNLMQAVIARGRSAAGIRLLQDGFNMASLALYTSLGFEVREPMAVMSGRPASRKPSLEFTVRPMTDKDAAACNALYHRAHGIERANDVNNALRNQAPAVVLRGGRVTGYMTAPAQWSVNHGTAISRCDMQALMTGAADLHDAPLAFLLPTRDRAMLSWALSQGLKTVKPMTLMTMGAYTQPKGAYLPSVFY